MEAAAKIEQKPQEVSGVLPVPDEIRQLNKRIAEGDGRLQNMHKALGETAKTISDHNAELKKLGEDEDKKLFQLAEAEAENRTGKTARDALDSIRGRRMLLTKKVADLDADQTGRQKAIAKLTDELSGLRNQRDVFIKQWRIACYQNQEENLRATVHHAMGTWVEWMIGAGEMWPQFHNPQWVRVHILRALDQSMNARGEIMRQKLIAQAKEAK